MKKLLITGGYGKLASEIIKANKEYSILAPGKDEMDITYSESVLEYMSYYQPDIVLHAGAYTKPMKKHEEHPDISIRTNIIGTSNVVLGCMSVGCKIVYISTDLIFK